MYCPKCGKECNEGAKFCTQCGFNFSEVTKNIDDEVQKEKVVLENGANVNEIKESSETISNNTDNSIVEGVSATSNNDNVSKNGLASEYVNNVNTNQAPKEKKNHAGLVVVIVILLLAAIGGVSAYLLLNKDTKTDNNNGNSSNTTNTTNTSNSNTKTNNNTNNNNGNTNNTNNNGNNNNGNTNNTNNNGNTTNNGNTNSNTNSNAIKTSFDNYNVDITMTMVVSGISMDTKLTGIVDEKHQVEYFKMTMSVMGMNLDYETYADLKNGITYMTNPLDEDTWIKQTGAASMVNLDDMLTSLKTMDNVEKIDDNHFKVKISSDDIKGLLESSDVDSDDIDGDIYADVFTNSNGYIEKIEYDFSDLMDEISDFTMVMKISNYNNAGDVVIPQNVIESATEY